MSENFKIFIVALALFLFIVWFTLAQPIWASQSSKDKAEHIEANNLKKEVYHLVEKYHDRVYTNTQMLDDTAEYIYKHFSKYSDHVEYQTFEVEGFLDDPTRKYKNVIAHFTGREGCSEEVYVIGGHYDTFKGHAGANDNTSAVAGLLELARAFKENPPKCNLQLVAYTLEEPPFFRTAYMGSYIHAKSLKEQNIKVKLAIVLDMIGFFSDKENSQAYPFPLLKAYYPSRANFISIVSNLSLQNILATREAKEKFVQSSNLSTYSMNAFSFIPGIDFSDHHNYWKFDYPAILISDTAFYRSQHYHKESDTPEKLDYEKMAKVVEGVFSVVQ